MLVLTLQMLLGVYFFLAGWAVGQRRAVLLVPFASATCAALLYLASLLSAAFSTCYRCATICCWPTVYVTVVLH